MRNFLIVGLVLALVVLAGCKKDSNPAGSTGGVPSQLAGTWTAQSATVNNAPVALADVLQWLPNTASARFTFGANGTYTYTELDAGGNTIYTETGTASVSGQNFTVTITSSQGQPVSPPVVISGTWSVSGNTLTVSFVQQGATVVITMTK